MKKTSNEKEEIKQKIDEIKEAFSDLEFKIL